MSVLASVFGSSQSDGRALVPCSLGTSRGNLQGEGEFTFLRNEMARLPEQMTMALTLHIIACGIISGAGKGQQSLLEDKGFKPPLVHLWASLSFSSWWEMPQSLLRSLSSSAEQ